MKDSLQAFVMFYEELPEIKPQRTHKQLRKRTNEKVIN